MKQRFETFVTAISSINRSLQRLKNTEMADFGLKGTHVMCLYQLQKHEEGLNPSQLTQLCDADKAAVSRTISELKDQGLVCIPEDSEKRYRKQLRLTDRGRQVADVMDGKIMDAVKVVSQGYSLEEREVFTRVLLRVSENLQAACVKEDHQ